MNLSKRSGFTLIEVMIALALSLLVLLAVTKSFAIIGEQITASQSELELNADLRDIVGRLEDEMSENRMTVLLDDGSITPGSETEGYFAFHEGPMTNMTTSHIAMASSPGSDVDFFESNRYGDCDDYLAFTATAPADAPFMGYLPRGILKAIELQRIRANGRPNYNFPAAEVTELNELVPFYSTEAEIAYWLSPNWRRRQTGDATAGTLQYDATSGYPQFRDNDGDLIPDTFNLHRRVLLIRDDLNLTVGEIYTANGLAAPPVAAFAATRVVPFLKVGTSSQSLVALSSDALSETSANLDFFDGRTTDYVEAPGAWDTAADGIAPNWLVGIARMQQVMDLSISRVTNNWHSGAATPGIPLGTQATPPPATPAASSRGMPSRLVQANILGAGPNSVARPENRFGYVRMPASLLANGSTGVGSTMPQLALAPPHPFMTYAEETKGSIGDEYVFAEPADIVRDLPAQADPNGFSGGTGIGNDGLDQSSSTFYDNLVARYGRFTMTGLLRPEFALADRIEGPNAAPGGGTTTPALAINNRGGSDIIATDVLGFDVQIYDPQLRSFMWVGPDGLEGSAGDDDGDGVYSDNMTSPAFDNDELGFPGSDDQLVTLNDLIARRALTSDVSPTAAVGIPYKPLATGGFVDLGYLRIAGHPFGSIRPTSARPLTDVTARLAALQLDNDPLAGFVSSVGGGLQFPSSLQDSGKFVISKRNDATGALVNSYVQTTYDTWTDYTGDGFDQEGHVYEPSRWDAQSYTLKSDEGTSTDYANDATEVAVQTKIWSNMTALGGGGSPDPATPPVADPLQGIQIQLRLFDPGVGRVRQQSIISNF